MKLISWFYREIGGGLTPLRDYECQIIDPLITAKFQYWSNNENANGIMHWALVQENLLDDIVESIEEAYLRFLEIIKSEGLVDKDFY